MAASVYVRCDRLMNRPNCAPFLIGSVICFAAIGCQGGATIAVQDPFEWSLGLWQGVRRDVASGTEAEMVMRVEPLLGGFGQIRTLEIQGGSGVYRGTAVQQLDRDSGQWFWQYTNSVDRPVARYRGEVNGARSVWSSISLERTRESRLVSECMPDGTWLRSMSVSTDGGQTWTGLWVDELQPVSDSAPEKRPSPR